MIRAVLFDYGGVLNPGGVADSHASILGDHLGLDLMPIQIEDLHHRFRRGAMSTEGFASAVNARFPNRVRDIDADTWQWPGIYTRHELVYDYAAKLRSCGITTGIVSNIWAPLADLLAQRGAYDDFNPLVLSCRVGLAKPDPRIYEFALQQLSFPPSEVLFVDDQTECLTAASTAGMQTLLATDQEQVATSLAAAVCEQNGKGL